MGQIVDDIESVSVHDFDHDDVQHLKDLASEAPVIRLVGLIIRQRWKRGPPTSTSSPSRTA